MDLPVSVFSKALLQAAISDGYSLRILQAIFIAKTSKYTESRDKAVVVTVPWPPGSMSEPSCSRGSLETSPPELLEFPPDLLRSHLSFLGVGADLTCPWGLGPGIRASPPQGPPCHMVTALLRDQDKVLLLAHTFPTEHV